MATKVAIAAPLMPYIGINNILAITPTTINKINKIEFIKYRLLKLITVVLTPVSKLNNEQADIIKNTFLPASNSFGKVINIKSSADNKMQNKTPPIKKGSDYSFRIFFQFRPHH